MSDDGSSELDAAHEKARQLALVNPVDIRASLDLLREEEHPRLIDYIDNPAIREALSEREAVFVEWYAVTLSAPQAAVAARGEDTPSIRHWGSVARARPHVREAINEVLKIRGGLCNINAQLVTENLQRNYQLAIDKGDISGANKAVELLGKSIGMFSNEVKLGVDDSLSSLIMQARKKKEMKESDDG